MYKPLFAAAAVVLSQTLFAGAGSPAACLTTLPPSPSFIPPKPYTASEGFWFGTNALWVHLPIKLTAGQGQKLFVWSEDYKDPRSEPKPAMVVTGRRLDGGSRPFIAQHATNVINIAGGPAMLIGVTVPEAGCWELTVFYRDATLSFIVPVEH